MRIISSTINHDKLFREQIGIDEKESDDTYEVYKSKIDFQKIGKRGVLIYLKNIPQFQIYLTKDEIKKIVMEYTQNV